MRRNIIVIAFVIIACNVLFAQDETPHLFQGFFSDALITPDYYCEIGFDYQDFEYASLFDVKLQGGYQLMSNIEIGGGLSFTSISPDYGDGNSGINDLLIHGRYKFDSIEFPLAAGVYMTLPIGSEDIGAGNLNYGLYGAIQHQMMDNLTLTGNLGLDFYEVTKYDNGKLKDEYENSFNIGFGSLFEASPQFTLIPELSFRSEGDYALFSIGSEYTMAELPGKIRAFFGFGLDDGAPDVILGLGMLF